MFYRGNISQFNVSQIFKKYYETGPGYEKVFHRKHRNKSQENNKNKEESEKDMIPSFNEGVENMPKYFAEWNTKGRNFKICEQSPYDHLEATSVNTSSQIYFYLEDLHKSFKLYFVHQYVGAGMEEEEFPEARESLAAFSKDAESYSFEYFGCYCCRFGGEGDEEDE